MKIAVLGPGAIGSTFAFRLAKAGHAVTVIARGARLAHLEATQAIVTAGGERAPVQVARALDAQTPWDLVLVTVLAPQVDAVLPSVAQSAAKSVMFMFNTFEPFTRLRDAVGAHRFTFGFPAILASLNEGVLTTQIVTRGQVTTVTDPKWAEVFTAAGIASVVHPDMESWLRTHAAMVVPFMLAVGTSYARNAGITFGEAWGYARALDEGFRLVRTLGNRITPGPMVALGWMPTPMTAALLWVAARIGTLRRAGAAGFTEPHALIDAMAAAAPEAATARLRASKAASGLPSTA